MYQGKSDNGELFKKPISVFRSLFAAKLENCAVFLGKKIRISVWHKKLRHPSEEALSTMLKTANVLVCSDSCQSICSTYIMVKCVNCHFL